MKILIFSDTHLGKRFDEKKYSFLKKIITQADRVIINGDFWEGYAMTFDQLIASPWKKLFPLLKKKKAVYVFGNHDKKSYGDSRVKLFSVEQTKQYRCMSGGKTFFVEHGDRYCPMWDEMFKRMPEFIMRPLESLERWLVRTFKKRFLTSCYGQFNDTIRRTIAGKFKDNEYVVCGHTHLAEIDLTNRYVNSGIIKHGLGQYLIIQNGRITAGEEWYDKP